MINIHNELIVQKNKTYKTYKDSKINDIVFLLYNNNEKLTKDIGNILLNNKNDK